MYYDIARCKKCKSPVIRRIHVDNDGVPRWTCPCCGSIWNGSDFYKMVSSEEATDIIELRYPEGYFMVKENGKFVGIDNSTGDAWTKEFDSEDQCIRWLAGEEFYDGEESDHTESNIRVG